MAEATARAAVPGDERADHLRSVDTPVRRAKFAALDHEVARVLGPHRPAANIYAYLASAWYEFASPEALRGIEAKTKRSKTPGDWVDVTYAELMKFSGTNSRASIIRWIRILAEERHECPWGRCSPDDQHPLIVSQRVGRSRPNRYRRWKCGEDTLVVRRRIRSAELKARAQERVRAGQLLNGHPASSNSSSPLIVKSSDETSFALIPLPIEAAPFAEVKSFNETSLYADSPSRNTVSNEVKSYSETSQTERVISLLNGEAHDVKSHNKTSASLMVAPSEVPRRDLQKSYDETSLRVNSPKSLNKTAKDATDAAAQGKSDENDAVACEVVDEILALAQRTEPSYRDDQAWSVARRLAPIAIAQATGSSAGARALLLAAIGDRRIARASNPVGLLIRGVMGDENGDDRFLLNSAPAQKHAANVSMAPAANARKAEIPPGMMTALLDALRNNRKISPEWLRERDIPASVLDSARKIIEKERLDSESATPLCDRLESNDPISFQEKLETAARLMKPPVTTDVLRSHPMIARMCRANCEILLRNEAIEKESK